jgi:biotin carboxylase
VGRDHGSGSRRLLVLGAGPAQLGLLEAARRRGVTVIAADRDPGATGFRLADRRAIVSVEDEPAVDRLAAAEAVDGVIAPGTDWPVVIAARVAERLGLPHPLTPATAALTTSKLRQRERFAAAGVPQPAYRLCRTAAEATDAAGRVGYPCVVKPPDRQGQRGVAVVSEPGRLPEAFAAALSASRSGAALVEELVRGREITVNGFSLGGRFHPLTITDRLLAEPPAFGVALAHAWRCSLAPAEIGAAVGAAAAAAAALGVEQGPTYTQLRVGQRGGIRVGELAARLGGSHDAELCEAALGIDLNTLALCAALGEDVSASALVPRAQAGGACVRFLVAPRGELEAVQGVEEAAALTGVRWVRIYRAPGRSYGDLVRGADRAGAVLAVGDDRDDALARADRAADLVRFRTSGDRERAPLDA